MVEWIFTQLYWLFSMPKQLHHIGMITYRIAKAVTNSNAGKFRHPFLSDTEHVEGSKLGIDYWSDTCCAGKHAFVEEIIEGKSVTAMQFKASLGSVSNLIIENAVYAYDNPDGTVLLLECNNLIYLGQKMSDSILNPIQAEEVGFRVDTQPKLYYLNGVDVNHYISLMIQLFLSYMKECFLIKLFIVQRRKNYTTVDN